MKCAVYDTYVQRNDGDLMHFDIIVPENTLLENVLRFGEKYLANKNVTGGVLSSKECSFCHIEEANELIKKTILDKGYFIYEMQGCN